MERMVNINKLKKTLIYIWFNPDIKELYKKYPKLNKEFLNWFAIEDRKSTGTLHAGIIGAIMFIITKALILTIVFSCIFYFFYFLSWKKKYFNNIFY